MFLCEVGSDIDIYFNISEYELEASDNSENNKRKKSRKEETVKVNLSKTSETDDGGEDVTNGVDDIKLSELPVQLLGLEYNLKNYNEPI